MSLAFEALKYINRARRNPADAGDPNLLARLEKYAKQAWEGIAALHAPASPMTWEVRMKMLGSVQTSNRTPFTFPRPVEIVGFLPTIITITNGALITPNSDVLQVSIDTDMQQNLTSGEGISTNAGGNVGPYVTLSAMSVQTPRILGYKLENPKPNIGFTFRWALDVSGGAVYEDCIVALAMYARYL
jgi:hypothetical protein